ncbi:MAG: hypothetical protein IT285_03385 [Bdellovibrionales bacterium]|nr:hypothetical protein [Bdellovibrionales bacterium]
MLLWIASGFALGSCGSGITDRPVTASRSFLLGLDVGSARVGLWEISSSGGELLYLDREDASAGTPLGLGVHPTQPYAYVFYSTGGIEAIPIDVAAGTLGEPEFTAYPLGFANGNEGLVDFTGAYLLVAGQAAEPALASFELNFDGSIASAIHHNTITAGGALASALALHPNGTRVITATQANGFPSFILDLGTGMVTAGAGTAQGDANNNDVEITRDGEWMIATVSGGAATLELRELDPSSGVQTSDPTNSGISVGTHYMVFDELRDRYYLTKSLGGGVRAVSVDLSTGGAMEIDALDLGASTFDEIALSPDGRYLYLSDVGGGGYIHQVRLGDDNPIEALVDSVDVTPQLPGGVAPIQAVRYPLR